jgi:hypothetical protein
MDNSKSDWLASSHRNDAVAIAPAARSMQQIEAAALTKIRHHPAPARVHPR